MVSFSPLPDEIWKKQSLKMIEMASIHLPSWAKKIYLF